MQGALAKLSVLLLLYSLCQAQPSVAEDCVGPTILCQTPPPRPAVRKDKLGRAYNKPLVNLANCTARKSINFNYILENHGYAYPELVGTMDQQYPALRSRLTVESIGRTAALKFSEACTKICWQATKRAPLGGGWRYIGNYGSRSAETCQDTYVKLISRRGTRIEVVYTTVNRMSTPEYPDLSYSRSEQIQCNAWNYWDGSSWAPISSNTRLDNAAKQFC